MVMMSLPIRYWKYSFKSFSNLKVSGTAETAIHFIQKTAWLGIFFLFPFFSFLIFLFFPSFLLFFSQSSSLCLSFFLLFLQSLQSWNITKYYKCGCLNTIINLWLCFSLLYCCSTSFLSFLSWDVPVEFNEE